jgi:CheY-like chemotaxis protein
VRILLAEDTLDIQHLWEWFLTNAGHEVHCVNNGAEAVQIVATTPYDIIVMDVEMPAMNGWNALHRIRQLPNAAHVPVIMVSAYHQRLWEEQLEQSGANKLLYKPMLPQDLLTAIEEVELAARQSRETEL